MIGKIISSVIVIFFTINFAYAQQSVSFDDYLATLKDKAALAGVSQHTIDKHFSNIKVFKRATANGSNKALNLESYIPQNSPEITVSTARAMFKEQQQSLIAIGDRYGVQPRFLVALWGMTSEFGEQKGNFPILSVTASNAYSGNKEQFYIDEFIAALKILDTDQVQYEQLIGSSTGAMGHMQLMPSQYLAHAQDGNGDGIKDIWNNQFDAFATAASMLRDAGWKNSETWGRQVSAINPIESFLVGTDHTETFNEWQDLGVRRYNGNDLPKRDDMQVSLLMPDGANGRQYLVYNNFRLLQAWSVKEHFLLTVTYLSERIKNPPIN
ncbi:lytic transglycosylase domain-containing protein [Shewanella sp. KT0246]|uniref:lytic murein transglycosylase n=1 Tax=Shewanella sp. KT0246 TaxID=2815912 RepID=UPI001BBD04AA|nr:lytic murein transglycosylase [Shewanella sp. KT0246]GIU54065.1 lytic transglycosylase [Shewanella sp. KT0246]